MMSGSFQTLARLAAVTVLAFAITACTGVRERLGLVAQAPNEFNVVTRAPLRVPPTLEELPVPQPGLARPQELQPTEEAQIALFGNVLADGSSSTGERILVAEAAEAALTASGDVTIDPNIRGIIDEEHTYILNDSTWLEDINPMTSRGDPTEVLIDVAKERERLQKNAALGLPANAGNFEGVIVVEEEKALFEDLF